MDVDVHETAAPHPAETANGEPPVRVCCRVSDLVVTGTSEVIEVTVASEVVGFIDVVGNVFVALSGERYDRAVEVAQLMSIDAAQRVLCSTLDAHAALGHETASVKIR